MTIVILNYAIFIHLSLYWVIIYKVIYFIPSFTRVYYGILDLYILVMPKR